MSGLKRTIYIWSGTINKGVFKGHGRYDIQRNERGNRYTNLTE